LLPTTLFITYLLAPGADGQQPRQFEKTAAIHTILNHSFRQCWLLEQQISTASVNSTTAFGDYSSAGVFSLHLSLE